MQPETSTLQRLANEILDSRCPYQVLGLASNTGLAEVKAAYRRLCLVFHPDKSTLPTQLASQVFHALQSAYSAVTQQLEPVRQTVAPKDIWAQFYASDPPAAGAAPTAHDHSAAPARTAAPRQDTTWGSARGRPASAWGRTAVPAPAFVPAPPAPPAVTRAQGAAPAAARRKQPPPKSISPRPAAPPPRRCSTATFYGAAAPNAPNIMLDDVDADSDDIIVEDPADDITSEDDIIQDKDDDAIPTATGALPTSGPGLRTDPAAKRRRMASDSPPNGGRVPGAADGPDPNQSMRRADGWLGSRDAAAGHRRRCISTYTRTELHGRVESPVECEGATGDDPSAVAVAPDGEEEEKVEDGDGEERPLPRPSSDPNRQRPLDGGVVKEGGDVPAAMAVAEAGGAACQVAPSTTPGRGPSAWARRPVLASFGRQPPPPSPSSSDDTLDISKQQRLQQKQRNHNQEERNLTEAPDDYDPDDHPPRSGRRQQPQHHVAAAAATTLEPHTANRQAAPRPKRRRTITLGTLSTDSDNRSTSSTEPLAGSDTSSPSSTKSHPRVMMADSASSPSRRREGQEQGQGEEGCVGVAEELPGSTGRIDAGPHQPRAIWVPRGWRPTSTHTVAAGAAGRTAVGVEAGSNGAQGSSATTSRGGEQGRQHEGGRGWEGCSSTTGVLVQGGSGIAAAALQRLRQNHWGHAGCAEASGAGGGETVLSAVATCAAAAVAASPSRKVGTAHLIPQLSMATATAAAPSAPVGCQSVAPNEEQPNLLPGNTIDPEPRRVAVAHRMDMHGCLSRGDGPGEVKAAVKEAEGGGTQRQERVHVVVTEMSATANAGCVDHDGDVGGGYGSSQPYQNAHDDDDRYRDDDGESDDVDACDDGVDAAPYEEEEEAAMVGDEGPDPDDDWWHMDLDLEASTSPSPADTRGDSASVGAGAAGAAAGGAAGAGGRRGAAGGLQALKAVTGEDLGAPRMLDAFLQQVRRDGELQAQLAGQARISALRRGALRQGFGRRGRGRRRGGASSRGVSTAVSGGGGKQPAGRIAATAGSGGGGASRIGTTAAPAVKAGGRGGSRGGKAVSSMNILRYSRPIK